MLKQKLISTVSGLVAYSMFITPIAFGQINNQVNVKSKNTFIVKEIKFSKYLQDLTKLAESGQVQFVSGFDAETDNVLRVLTAVSRKNAVLLNEYSANSSSIFNNIAFQSVKENAPTTLKGKRILKLNLNALIADSGSDGEVEGKLQSIFASFEQSNEKIILILENTAIFNKDNPQFGFAVALKLRKLIADEKNSGFNIRGDEGRIQSGNRF